MMSRLITFESLGDLYATKYSYEVVGKRPPKKGEYYLSGAEVMAYKAPNDLSSDYIVVRPLVAHKQVRVWRPTQHGHEAQALQWGGMDP